MTERYCVATSSGYHMKSRDGQLIGGTWVVEWMVLDRAWCHQVVWSSLTSPRREFGTKATTRIQGNEGVAKELCRRLNAADIEGAKAA